MAEPVNGPGFGAREDEMGIVFAAFKPPGHTTKNAHLMSPAADKRRMNGRFELRSAFML